jgi:hypothetical protein
VPDAVRDIQLVFDEASGTFNSSTQLLTILANVSWLPPQELYGVLLSYSVTISNGDTIIRNLTVSSAVTSISEDVQVNATTGYLVNVVATTGGGSSSNVSSVTISPETGENLPRAPDVVALFGIV